MRVSSVLSYSSGAAMTEALTVYLHFPCFDGVTSAALACEYLERKFGWKTATLVPVDYSRRATWLETPLPSPAAVVDFLYHPDSCFWADHHPTTFMNPNHGTALHNGGSCVRLYDPNAGSCAEVIWRSAHHSLRESRFKEMVEWAHRIDSAKYSSVEEAVMGDAPAIRINLSLLRDSSEEYCRFLVNAMRKRPLDDVAASSRVTQLYQSVRRALGTGQDQVSRNATIQDGVVVFRAREDAPRSLVSRYAPYLKFPQALYSVGILENESGAKITAMRNPWRRFRSVPLGQIFSRYGGGGHQRVASLLVNNRLEAEATLPKILDDIRRARSATSPARQAAMGD
jgi:hypothetical protein